MDKHRLHSYFFQEDEAPLFAEELLILENVFTRDFPGLQLSPAYWDITFRYIKIKDLNDRLGIQITLSNRGAVFSFSLPSELLVDYFVTESQVLPIRPHDFRALSELLPKLDGDPESGLSIKDLIQFSSFASTHDFLITNPEMEDGFLSSARIDISNLDLPRELVPYPYQSIGISWLIAQQSLGRHGVVLGDVMGLGKTIQAIGLITHNSFHGRQNNLVICPSTLIENWRRELVKFSPSLKVLTHTGAMRAGTASKVRDFDVVLTSYDILVRDHSLLSSVNWNLVILDEAQAIKNPYAQRTKRCKLLNRSFSVAITGTPLENKLLDLWSLADFASPGIFGVESRFEDEYAGTSEGAIKVNKILRPMLLRRGLDEIEHQLPKKVVIDHALAWPTELIELYEKTRLDALAEYETAGGLVATGRLRKLTTHPALMEIGPRDLTAISPKYTVLLQIVQELFENGEKCLVFASYKAMIDLIVQDLGNKFPNTLITSLDGRTPIAERVPLVEDFNANVGPGALICNPIVAGAGLNITGANHVIHYNLEWNPAKEDQATFRVYRNGQLKETFVHRLFYIDTIDEVIDQRIQSKRLLSDLSVDTRLNREDYLAGLQISPLRGRK